MYGLLILNRFTLLFEVDIEGFLIMEFLVISVVWLSVRVFKILALNLDECFIIILLKWITIWVLNIGWLVYINFIDGLIKDN